MAIKLGNGKWAVKENNLLAYNDNSGKFFNKEFDFTRGSSATYVGKDGLIKTAGQVNTPRIDFSGSANGALLLEPQRTNLIPYSEDFSQSTWNKGTGTVTANTSISPDGTLSADKFTSASTSSYAFLSQTVSADASQTYTYSIWIKKVSGSGVLRLAISDVYSATVQSANKSLTTEFVRYSFTIASGDLSNTGFIGAGFVNMTSGDVIEVWGAQLEAGSYPTSYIPTQGAAATRIAETCNNSGSVQDFNSEEGVLYAEISALANDGTNRRIAISDNSTNNRVVLGFAPTNNAILALVASSGTQFISTIDISDVKLNNKFALKYKENDFALWVNGIEVATDTSGNAPIGLSTLRLEGSTGASDFYGNVIELQVFTEALTDAQLQALTTI